MSMNLTPLSECIDRLKEDAADCIKRSKERIERDLAENIKALERNRMVLPALEALVGEEALRVWFNGREITIDLGMRPSKGKHKKEAFRKLFSNLRLVLGQLPLNYKDASNVELARKGIAWFYHSAAGFSGIQIRYRAKVPKGAKCRIVKNVSYSVVCES